MTVAAGTDCYNLGTNPCTGKGVSWTKNELDDAINDPVAGIVFDDEGTADLDALLSSVADTEFAHEELARVLAPADSVEDWRVGEAIAESYLTEHRDCFFPWPDGRDKRKTGSSLPGADLVGFHVDGIGDRFSFGEVKTSHQNVHPPGTVYGRTGLKKQLEDLRDDKSIRDGLMKYLGYRAVTALWRGRYEAASKRYLENNSDIQLYGVLVRDVKPHENDVRSRVEKLAEGCPSGSNVELLAVYLPRGEISNLADKALAVSQGGAS